MAKPVNRELQLELQQLDGDVIISIVQHFWVNMASPQEPYVFLEWIEFLFRSSKKITLQYDPELEQLVSVDIDINNEKQAIQEAFGKRIFIKTEDSSLEPFWSDLVSNSNLVIEVNPILEDVDYPGCILLNCGTASYIIAPSANDEGIDIDKISE